METTTEYRVSERVCLRPGTVFRARHGPQYRMNDGSLVDMAARGPFVFLKCHSEGDLILIEAYDRNGHHTILHIAGERSSPHPEIVPRPYQIIGTKRRRLRCNTQRKSEQLKASHAKKTSGRRRRRLKAAGSGSGNTRRKPKQQKLSGDS